MVEDPKRKPLFVLAGILLLSSAQAGNINRTSGHRCADFQTANFLHGSKLNVRFLLFTPSSPSCGELILANDGIKSSSFNSSLETKIIIHGFRALGTKPSWIEGLVHAILHVSQVNVIAVDWVHGSTGAYHSAVENVTQLALFISHFINKLLALGVSATSIHIIGVSLGAHVGGLVGHFHYGQLGRITGLDPAGPKYTRASPEERLDPGDALFVEAIHTDADSFGIRIPVGHIDYFVNGGKDQPGCPRFISAGYKYLICDHMRAVHLYVSALKHSCPIVAFPCTSHQDFLNGHCVDCGDPFLFSCPRIGLLEQAVVNMRRLPMEVNAYLMTSSSAPFCVHHSLVEFRLQKIRNVITSIEITFFSNSTKDTTKITIQPSLANTILFQTTTELKDQAQSFQPMPQEDLTTIDKFPRSCTGRSPDAITLDVLLTVSPGDESPSLTAATGLTEPKQEEVGRRLLAHRAPLCQTNSVTLKYLPKNRFWRKDESHIVGKFCAAPLPLSNNRTMFCLPRILTLYDNTELSLQLSAACA